MTKGYPKPRKWRPKHPEKYIGDVSLIVARSSWEVRFLNWCDSNPNVLKYCSEEIVIPYVSPIDGRVHRYFVDMLVQLKTRSGKIQNVLIEIKPLMQTQPPKKTSGKSKDTYLNEVVTYETNRAKWEAAEQWCQKHDMKFMILTEKELFGK